MFRFAASGIVIMCMAMMVAPNVSWSGYDWVKHTTSELGGQSMPNAVLMNIGFAAYGIGVFVAAFMDFSRRKLTNCALLLFGVGLIGASLFSAMPVDPSLDGSLREDSIHSFFASLIGFAFAAATASRLFGPNGDLRDWGSWAGLIASVAIPLAMLQFPNADGALQRAMFAISFIWVLRFYRSLRLP